MAINLMLGKHSISSSSVDMGKINEHIDNADLHISTIDRQNLESIKHNKGTFNSESELRTAYSTANVGDYCICFNGTNYTMWTYNTDWVDTMISGNTTSVNSMTGDVVLDATNVNYSTGISLKTEIDNKLNNDEIKYATNSDIDNLF